MLATPLAPADVALGEVFWALLRGTLYAIALLLVMLGLGLLTSPWAILALPAALLIGFAFAGMAASSFMRSWQDFEWINLVVLPMFLLSTTFYPLRSTPRACARWWPPRRSTKASSSCAGWSWARSIGTCSPRLSIWPRWAPLG